MSGKTFKEASTIRTNFHSHTTRCQHATGADEDYVLAAIAAGYSHLGFSDHSPFPYEDGFVSGMRMRIDQYQDYLGSVRELRERYQDQISIHLGVEAEYYERYQGWLAGQLSSGTLEYLILGSHYDLPEESFYFGEANTPALLRRYAEHTIRGMESALDLKLRKFVSVLYVAEMGRPQGIPLFDSIVLLGRERALQRIRTARLRVG